LRVATDPTTAATSDGGNRDRSYDFISVEEAEEALRRERLRYQQERSELQWLLENQRKQLQALANKKRESERNGGKTRGTSGENPSKRIVVRGSHAHMDINPINGRNRKTPNTNGRGRSRANEKDATYDKMKRLESLLQDAIVDNEKLTSQLHAQKHRYNAERKAYENELRKERSRLHSIRDELHMERAYFETSRRMLERLLEEEQRKVQQLEQELSMMMSRQRRTDERVQQQQRQHQAHQQQQNTQQYRRQAHQEQMHNTSNPKQQQAENTERVRRKVDFTMNINDVACPLYS